MKPTKEKEKKPKEKPKKAPKMKKEDEMKQRIIR